MKSACIYRRRERLFLRPWSKTSTGMWIEDGACIVLPLAASHEEIGRAVEAVLAQSRTGVGHPSREGWKDVVRPLLEAAGVKAWATFSKLANAVSIGVDDLGLRLQPLGRDPTGAYFPVPERDMRVAATVGDAEIGAAVLVALARAD